MNPAPPTVGVLYPGEMGAAVASLLRSRGVAVATTTQGRTAATAALGRSSGAVLLDSFSEVVRGSDVLISLVLPSAAEQVAAEYCAAAHMAPRGAIYVDANSIAPERAARIAARVEAAGRSYVDASINGLAKNLGASGTLFLSGPRAEEVARLFEGAARVKLLGSDVGRASAMKMLLGGLSKGLCALFAELAVLAHEQGMLDEMLEAVGRTYGGVAAVAERMLPTYAVHAERRHTEMSELDATARAAGLTPRVIDGVLAFHEALARAMDSERDEPTGGRAGGAAAGSAAASRPGLSPLIQWIADRIDEREVV